jgi:uroporphyrinogen decarboxylase
MPRETMTPRERWLAVLRREGTDRVPMDYWATPEATARLKNHLGCSDDQAMYERLHIDRVITIGPAFVGPPPPPDEDIYGCRHRLVDYGTGVYSECVYSPLAQYCSPEEIERHYTWPSADWYDHSGIPAQLVGWETYPIRGGGSEPFLLYKKLRGEEQAFVDLIENPQIVEYCLAKLFDLAYEHTRRLYEQAPGQVMISYVAEDLGGQEGLMFSREHIRRFLLPGMKRMTDLAHQAGAYVFFHSDGAIREVLPEMIALGIDVLNPIQWRCRGMEREGLKRDFGEKVVFHGGVDNQHTLAFGAVEEVRQEVRKNLEVLGAGGGYVLAPCHNIQAVSPPENVVALYETGYEEGWLG